jgi:hypothetical protein
MKLQKSNQPLLHGPVELLQILQCMALSNLCGAVGDRVRHLHFTVHAPQMCASVLIFTGS